MEKNDERWLLTSVAKAWDDVRRDARNGWIWTEKDAITSFHNAFRSEIMRRNENTQNGLGKMRLLAELIIYPTNPEDKGQNRMLDLALVEITDATIPKPSKIIAHFEFKYAWLYSRANIENKVRSDLLKMIGGNDGWTIWGKKKYSAKTDYAFFGLIADNWEEHIKGSSSDPNNDGILHPNGTVRYSKLAKDDAIPRIDDHMEGLKYFELHGPFPTKSNADAHLLDNPDVWGLYEIDKRGDSKRIIKQA